jgi:uncharacterized protein YdaU (DUF1376 family)
VNYYKRHLGDYAKDAGHLTVLEHGVYTLLLDRYYSVERPLSSSEAYKICRARTPLEREAVDGVLSEFFQDTTDGWRNRRADEEIAAYNQKAERNREVGKKGGRPKASGNPEGNPDGFKNETQTVPGNNPSHKPLATKEQELKAPAAPADFRADLFARWKSTPNSGGGAFLGKLFKDHKPEQRVLEALEHTLDDTRADPKAFVLGILNKQARSESELDDILRGAL